MICFRLLDAKDPALELRNAVSKLTTGASSKKIYKVKPSLFTVLPNASFSYWAIRKILEIFKNIKTFETDKRKALVGIQTSDDPRFVRLHWEVIQSNHKETKTWHYILKGDSASRFYDDISMVVKSSENFKEIEAFPGSVIRNSDYYFNQGFSWAKRTNFFMPSCVPRGCIPSVSRYLAVSPEVDLRWLVAVGNSTVFDYIFKLCLEKDIQPVFITGTLNLLPLSVPNEHAKLELSSYTNSAWSVKRKISTINPISHAFYAPALAPSRVHSTPDSK